LDIYVEKLRGDFDKGEKPSRSSEYRKYEHLVRKAKINQDPTTLKEIAKTMITLPYLNYRDPEYKRLKYVRYADY
jgi:hypothetical protein